MTDENSPRNAKITQDTTNKKALVAQLDRAPDYGSGGWGFDSLRVHQITPQLYQSNMKIYLTRLLIVLTFAFLTNCASGINSSQKKELSSYKAKGFYVEEKKVGLAAGLGILPGGGSFYSREYGLGIVNLLIWPFSVLWDPISGYNASERINYYATKANLEGLKKEEIDELSDQLMLNKIDNKTFILKKRDIEERYGFSQ